MIGERDRAVRLLLDADASNQHFYTDCLRACLLSATHHSAQAQSTIKLVATNLIAAGNIWEGRWTGGISTVHCQIFLHFRLLIFVIT